MLNSLKEHPSLCFCCEDESTDGPILLHPLTSVADRLDPGVAAAFESAFGVATLEKTRVMAAHMRPLVLSQAAVAHLQVSLDTDPRTIVGYQVHVLRRCRDSHNKYTMDGSKVQFCRSSIDLGCHFGTDFLSFLDPCFCIDFPLIVD